MPTRRPLPIPRHINTQPKTPLRLILLDLLDPLPILPRLPDIEDIYPPINRRRCQEPAILTESQRPYLPRLLVRGDMRFQSPLRGLGRVEPDLELAAEAGGRGDEAAARGDDVVAAEWVGGGDGLYEGL
jgi:hypothetical protein